MKQNITKTKRKRQINTRVLKGQSPFTFTKSRKGGDVIGAGAYGCVFKPALRCTNSDKRTDGISKLLENKIADNEWHELNKVKSIVKKIPNYEKYFLLSDLEKCKPNKLTESDMVNIQKCDEPLISVNVTNINSELDKLQIINIPFGGHSIKEIIEKSIVPLYAISYALITLLKNAILPMNKLGIFHFDLKADNVLYKDKYAKIIDWGISGISTSKQILPKLLLNSTLLFNAPFSRILFSEHLDEYLKFNLTKYTEINKNSPILYKQLYGLMMYYYELWVNAMGPGQEAYLNNVVLPDIFKLANKQIPKRKNLVQVIVSSYCAKVFMKYIDFKTKTFNANKYFTEVYSKNVDVWGLIICYLPLILEKTNNKYLTLQIKINIANIIIKYCFSGEYANIPIHVDRLIVDLVDITNENNKQKSILNIQGLMQPLQFLFGEKVRRKSVKSRKPRKPRKTRKTHKAMKSLVSKKHKHSKKTKKFCPPGTKRKVYCQSRGKLFKYKRRYNRCPNTTRKVYLCKRKGKGKPLKPQS